MGGKGNVIRKLGIEVDFGGNASKEIAAFAKKAYDAKQGLQDFGSAADKSKRSVFGFGDAMRTVAAGAVAGKMFGLGKELVGIAANYEQTSVAFQTMIGSKEAADKTIADLNNFANVTPFEPGSVNEAAKTLLSFNVTTKDLIPLMQKVGDVAAGTGKDYASLAAMVGKAHAINKVDNEMLQQVPVLYGALAKSMGVTEQQVMQLASSGSIGFKEMEAALGSLTSAGGKFEGMMQKQSRTAGGLWSTLMGNIEAIKRSIGETLLTALKPVLEVIVSIATWISNSTVALTVIKGVLAVVTPLIGIMLVAALWSAVTAAWAMVAPLWAVAAAGIAAMAPFLPLIAIIGAVIWIVKDLWDGINGGDSVIMNIFGKIYDFFVWLFDAIGSIASKWQEIQQKLYSKIVGFFKNIWNKIKGFFRGVIDGFKSLGSRLIDFLTAPFRKAWATIKEFFGGIYDFFAGEKEITVNNGKASGVSHRASGGPVLSGASYLVGEHGPELFTPSSSGSITPNHKLSRGHSAATAQITLSPVFNISGADPEAISQAVMRKIEGLLPSVRHQLGLSVAGLGAA